MRAFKRRFAKQHAFISQNTDFEAHNAGKTTNQSIPVMRLKFLQVTVVNQSTKNFMRIVWDSVIMVDKAINFCRVMSRWHRFCHLPAHFWLVAQTLDNIPGNRDSMRVVFSQVIRHTTDLAVHFPSAERLGINNLSSGGFHQSGTPQIHIALLSYDHRLITQGGHVSPTSGGRPMNDGNLGNTLRRHHDLVIKDGAHLPVIREDARLLRQVSPPTLNQGDTRQAVLPGIHLRTHVFFCRERIVRASLNRGVMRQDHAPSAMDQSYTRNKPATGKFIIMQI